MLESETLSAIKKEQPNDYRVKVHHKDIIVLNVCIWKKLVALNSYINPQLLGMSRLFSGIGKK